MQKTATSLLENSSQLRLECATILKRYSSTLKASAKSRWPILEARLQQLLPQLLPLYLELYGERYDCHYHLEQLLKVLAKALAQRPDYLLQEDEDPQQWHKAPTALGSACYVDLFAGDFKGLEQRIPYLQQTGINYLHLMPLFKAPEPNSDGGYAVSDYRKTMPHLGSMPQLAGLMQKLHSAGIRPVLDFVFNHTSDEHRWAEKAKAGEQQFQDYYFFFNEQERDQYAPWLREIFPEIRRGCFTFEPHAERWVWTTFNSFQWDLNYANPEVFSAMAEEMLFLANQGAAVLRLDALAFVWKEAGTSCENLPKAHTLIRAFNAVAAIAAPALQFKSEAIVHPDEVVKYIAPQECQLSYNPLLMALLWNSLATRKTRLLTESLQRRFAIDPQCSWVNYIRCHDDIGWTFDDNIAWQLGINPEHHRQFLNQFYTGQFAGSFATGVPFQQNPVTGDCRVAGMLASLTGVEQAVQSGNATHLQFALARIYLLNSIILSIGGLPLLYMGDELGLLNDYAYQDDPHKRDDSRWVNRVAVSEQQLAEAHNPDSLSGKIYAQLQQLIRTRSRLKVLGAGQTEILQSGNPHLFAYRRQLDQQSMLCVVNFSEEPQVFVGAPGSQWREELSGELLHGRSLHLAPYQVLWLSATVS
ncbi:alpha-amylase family glycosyl hydrolase [Alishewanella sp. SMS8]|uniref:alpha-amylase family glycosyl hydrolase n=1 Tax=Alishewanella sp. SMS8 TaxID=2994676 RepID=UPI002741947B|nr:alpha-amylase family glycosyl hydrolase [Alishewanella sp. SMS8]MDP5205989.1 alpha-amylase family glycosyl hydrolase [Alishewanella sp. SMS9]MDP5458907.1 alpha-amylase family glycosyl hydrolase [Alishewanella sp. SMS8]